MEKNQNLTVLQQVMNDQFEGKMAANTLSKCTKACFLSMQENELLPTEERCLTNCFIKSAQFEDYFNKELAYSVRNMSALNHQ